MAALPTTYAKRHGSVAENYRVLDCGGFSKSRRWQILPCRQSLIGEGDGMHAPGCVDKAEGFFSRECIMMHEVSVVRLIGLVIETVKVAGMRSFS